MGKMIWENLRVNLCPFCSESIKDSNNEVVCTVCCFHISKERMVSIIGAIILRETPGYVKKNWQNLNKNKCPICAYDLNKMGDEEIPCYRCSNKENCNFMITLNKYEELINDPKHSAYRFNNTEINPFTYEREFKK